MIRRAFTLTLKPGALAEYKEKHDNIWPEMVAEIERVGIARMTAFEQDPIIFYYSEVLDEEAWDRLWSSPVHDRWAEMFKELIAFDENARIEARFMPEIFRLDVTGK